MKGVVTNVYGPFQPSQKATFLEEIRHTKEWVGREHWIIGGDFNLIRSLEEKKGGVRSLSNISASFNSLEDKNRIFEGGSYFYNSTGLYLTFSKERFNPDKVDLSVAQVWLRLYSLMEILRAVGSNHWPICLEWGRLGEFVKRPFRFEKFWLQHPDFQRLVKEWWVGFQGVEGSCMYVFQQNLKHINECLKKWNRESFGHITLEKRKLEQQLEDIQTKTMKEGYSEEEKHVEKTIMQELMQREKQEEILWQQKSRKLWLREGDMNTSLFHKPTIQYRQQN